MRLLPILARFLSTQQIVCVLQAAAATTTTSPPQVYKSFRTEFVKDNPGWTFVEEGFIRGNEKCLELERGRKGTLDDLRNNYSVDHLAQGCVLSWYVNVEGTLAGDELLNKRKLCYDIILTGVLKVLKSTTGFTGLWRELISFKSEPKDLVNCKDGYVFDSNADCKTAPTPQPHGTPDDPPTQKTNLLLGGDRLAESNRKYCPTADDKRKNFLTTTSFDRISLGFHQVDQNYSTLAVLSVSKEQGNNKEYQPQYTVTTPNSCGVQKFENDHRDWEKAIALLGSGASCTITRTLTYEYFSYFDAFFVPVTFFRNQLKPKSDLVLELLEFNIDANHSNCAGKIKIGDSPAGTYLVSGFDQEKDVEKVIKKVIKESQQLKAHFTVSNSNEIQHTNQFQLKFEAGKNLVHADATTLIIKFLKCDEPTSATITVKFQVTLSKPASSSNEGGAAGNAPPPKQTPGKIPITSILLLVGLTLIIG